MTPNIKLFLWPHRLLFIGPGFDAELHRHHAAQLCCALGGSMRVKAANDEPWREAAAFFVPPDEPHAFDADVRTAILYLEPEGLEYSAYLARSGYPTRGISVVAGELNPAKVSEAAIATGCEPAEAACHALLGMPTSPPAPARLDDRIVEALAWIRARIRAPIRLADVADAVRLSESHFAHLFTEHVGVPMRRYVLWMRLRAAIEAAMRGASLTEAAHAAGLSDSAHLSRTFRDTFGVAPSFLFEHRALLDVHFCDS